MTVYAVRSGRETGLFESWDAVQPLVAGYSGAEHKKFRSRELALAWLRRDEAKEKPAKRAKRDTPPVVSHNRDATIVYCDGGCVRNGQRDARAAIGLFFGAEDARNCGRLLPPEMKQSNQTAELHAALEVLRLVPDGPLEIRTDSRYVIDSATVWRAAWIRKGWPQRLVNRDLLRALSDAVDARTAPLTWGHVAGHAGEAGNEAADRLAREALGLV